MVAFGAPRTFHRLVAGVEDAGLEIRDQLLWLYGKGLPKSRRLPGGLGTSLKPAYEPILLARAPLVGTTTSNLERLGHGRAEHRRRPVSVRPGYWPANVTSLPRLRLHRGWLRRRDCPAGLLDRRTLTIPAEPAVLLRQDLPCRARGWV